jgi:Ferritin-like domain
VTDDRSSRRDLLRKGTLAGAVLAGGALAGGAAKLASAGPSLAQDNRILNYLLLLERLQVDFYERAAKTGWIKGELRQFARVVGAQEREHVRRLEKMLGSGTGARRKSQLGRATSSASRFVAGAVALEETVGAAYIGQGANLSTGLISPIASITAVEARQAAWIRDIAREVPAPRAADAAKSEQAVMAALRGSGFVVES